MTRMPPDKLIEGAKTTSEKIRRLAAAGYDHGEIARHLGIIYQHVYNVLLAVGIRPKKRRDKVSERPEPAETEEYVSEPLEPTTSKARTPAEPVSSNRLLECGFRDCGRWEVLDGSLKNTAELPDEYGVYAIASDGKVVYIGVSKSLKRRMGEYRVGPAGQSTSKRVNDMIRLAIDSGLEVTLLIATPGKAYWMNLPVELSPGLEVALIEKFQPEWNKKGVVIETPAALPDVTQ